MRLWGLPALLLPFASAWAGEACPPARTEVPPRTFSLSTSIAAPVYHNDRRRSAITNSAGRQGVAERVFNTGLTRSATEFRVTPTIWSKRLGDGRLCVGIGKVEARWHMPEVRVDIASEYPPGSCQYRVVKEHEDEHVALNRQALQTFIPRMDSRLQDAVARFTPFMTDASPQQAADEAVRRLMSAARPVLDAFERERSTLNAAIDTPQNYRLVSSRCDGW